MVTEKLSDIAITNSAQGVLASYLLKKQDLYELKISDITKECFVSIATPTRLAKKIGLSGFTELKIKLIAERKLLDISPKVSNLVVKEQYTLHVIEHLNETFNTVSDAILNQITEIIHVAEKIDFFAVGETNLVAQDLAFKLDRLGKNISVYSDFHMQYIQAKKSDNKTVAIAISYSGTSSEVVKATKIAKSQGAKIILISNENCKNSGYADYFIGLKSLANISPKDKVVVRITLLAILDLIYLKLIDKDPCMYCNQLDITKYQI